MKQSRHETKKSKRNEEALLERIKRAKENKKKRKSDTEQGER